MNRKYIFSLACAVIFFISAFVTLKDYGISWDETIHFSRGQAYLYYFLTGKTNYNDLPNENMQGNLGKPENVVLPRRSFYQLDDFHNGEYFLNTDVGHPPLNDILAALSNYVFYQKLGIMDDISAYHLFNILAAAVVVFVVAAFAYEVMGFIPALVSVLALVTYPLFWSEAHFNIKDPPETAFFAATIWLFWKSLQKYDYRFLLLSVLFFAFGLGTKFNILFLPVILFPYLLFRHKSSVKVPKAYKAILLLSPLIVGGIFVATWPYLWGDVFHRILQIFHYYKGIGTEIKYQPESFFWFGFNTFPIKWIFFTTPPIVILLSVIGFIRVWLKGKQIPELILWFSWLCVPILRVTLPGTSIYGGVRQIFEFIPALALVTGLGAWQLLALLKSKLMFKVVVILLFIWPLYILVKMHPNQNVYFNFLVGGLKGAKEANFPSWGNSYGNAYLQGIKWINQNVPVDASLTLVQGTRLNVPPILVRKDVDFSGLGWSGIARKGEYLMDLTFNDTTQEFHYEWEYLDKFLDPVYEVKVDGVAILKVWKNDWEHTKKDYQLKEINYNDGFSIGKNSDFLEIDLRRPVLLSRVVLDYRSQRGCLPLSTSYVDTSTDGQNWQREKDWIPYPQVGLKSNEQDGIITYYLAGRKAKTVRFSLDGNNSCAFVNPRINIFVLE